MAKGIEGGYTMARTKDNETCVDPNFEAVLTRLDVFLPAIVAAMERTLNETRPDAEIIARARERVEIAQAVTAEANATVAQMKVEETEARAKVSLANVKADIEKANARCVLATHIEERVLVGELSVEEMAVTLNKMQRGY